MKNTTANILELPSNANKRVLVIGASGLDIVGRLENGVQTNTSNPAHIRTSYGGVARNIAENLARLGQPVSLITAVGADDAGQKLLEQASSIGVDTSHAVAAPGLPTGSYLAVLQGNGLLHLALDDMRVLSVLKPEILNQRSRLFQEAGILFVDANLSPASLRTVMALARKARLPVCADPTSRSLAKRLIPHLANLALVTPNAAEAAILLGEETPPSDPQTALAAARNLVNRGVGIAIITLGEYGVSYATSETSGHIPAIRTPILDPTGAGDALTAAVIFALMNAIPLDEALRLGVSAAALTLRSPGTVMQDLSLEKLYSELVI